MLKTRLAIFLGFTIFGIYNLHHTRLTAVCDGQVHHHAEESDFPMTGCSDIRPAR